MQISWNKYKKNLNSSYFSRLFGQLLLTEITHWNQSWTIWWISDKYTDLAYNEFNYNEHPVTRSNILCIKIIDRKVKRFGYNEFPLQKRSFFCILLLVLKAHSHCASTKMSKNNFTIEVKVGVADVSVHVNRSICCHRTHCLSQEKIDVVANVWRALNRNQCTSACHDTC